MANLNYKHLQYFREVARAGSIALAAERHHVTPQTISGQLALLEDRVGQELFKRVGRRLELNDAGRIALRYADDIFALGDELAEVLQQRPGGRPVHFRVGIVDAVPKWLAYRLVEPAMRVPEPFRIICREDKLADLLGELALHRLDVVIADCSMPPHVNVRGYSHLLGESGMAFFATPALARRYDGAFPRCLDGAPLLLPSDETVMRIKLVRWFEAEGINPNIIAEFDDSALMKAFGQAGSGIFCAPTPIADQVVEQYHVVEIGRTDALKEQVYAISIEHRITHPAVLAIRAAAREELFNPRPRRRRSGASAQ